MNRTEGLKQDFDPSAQVEVAAADGTGVNWRRIGDSGGVRTAAMVGTCLGTGAPVILTDGAPAALYALLASTAMAGVAAAFCTVAAFHSAGRIRAGWLTLGAGCLSWCLGNAYWSWNELVVHADVLFPSPADYGFVVFPIAGAAGLWLISAGSSIGSRLAMLLDGLIVAGALFVVSWVVALRSVWEVGADTPLAFVISVAYPVGDVVLATMAFLLAARTRRSGRTIVALFIIGLLGMTAADTIFAVATSDGTYVSGQASDAGWVVGFAGFAVAGWAARRRSVSPTAAGVMRRWQILLPYLPFGAAALITVDQVLSDQKVDAVQAILLFAGLILVFARQLVTLLHNSALTARLHHQAYHDPLTGLGNRALFTERLERALDRSGRRIAVLYLDLDDFKLVNDSLGHDAGDGLLRGVADRLRACAHPAATVARLGGDEFAVLVESIDDPSGYAMRMLDAMGQPFAIGTHTVSVHASVGVAVATPADRLSSEDLRKNVDLAMYAAKAQGKNTYALFDSAMRREFDEEMTLRADLTEALSSGGLHVAYQPLVDLADRRVVGVEALARWRHPTRGPVGPDTFIPAAERAGLVGDLGRFVLDRACAEFAAWSGASSAYLSVNVSPLQLLDEAFPAQVAGTLAEHGLQPRQLVLEVTENALADESHVIERLRRLRAMGVRVAIDDFGTGYSSLRYLRRFPADIIKIDRTYIQDIANDPGAVRMVATLWQLFAALGLVAVAEGIENEAQAAMLVDVGCPYGQGYLFSRPVALGEIARPELAAAEA